MSGAWYYESGGRQMGPLDDDMIKELIRSRDIRATNLVWRAGMENWLPCSEVAELAGLLPPIRMAPPSAGVASAAGMPAEPPPMAATAAPPQYNAWTPLAEQPAAAVSTLASTAAGVSHFCAVCGRPFVESDMIHYMGSWICAACKPAYFQRMREGAGDAGGGIGFAHYAGFWIRLAARFIDGLILLVPILVIMFALVGGTMLAMFKSGGTTPNPALMSGMQPAFVLVWFLAQSLRMLYYGFMQQYYSATLGKMAVGIKIVDLQGNPLMAGKAWARAVMYEILFIQVCCLWLIGLVGCIMAAFDDQKRALHDRICSTLVVYK